MKLFGFQEIDLIMRISLFLYRYFNSFCVLVLAALLVFFEIQTSFSEKLLGYYLYWQNNSRPKIGRMWEFQNKNISALGSIEEVVDNLKEVKSQVRDISTFRDLFVLINKEGDLAVSRSQFFTLQENLPLELSEIFFPPDYLLYLFYNSGWDRTFFIKGDMEIEVLLVDSDNRVLKKTTVDREQINLIKFIGETVVKPLNKIPEFKNRIYSVKEFFSGLQRMNEFSRSKILQDPDRFFKWGDRLKRVGISEFSRSGWIKIGYELENGLKKETAIFELNEFLVYELMDHINPGEEVRYYGHGRAQGRKSAAYDD